MNALKKKVQTAASITAASLIISVMAGCGSTDSKEQSAGKETAGNTVKTEISVSILDRGKVPTEEGTYESNRWTKWINENGPATVKWIPVLRNESKTKLNTLIASGSAPDLIWEFDRNWIAQLVNQGALQPLDNYIEKYSTTFKTYLKNNPELKPYLTFNGKIYVISSVRSIANVANHGMWIRQDWLDKLGLKAPTTTDEFLDVARKFKNGDPDGNGKNDTIPIAYGSNAKGIMNTMFLTHKDQWYLEGDKLVYGRLTDNYRDYMAFEKQLYDEGLIDKEYITDANGQRATQQWVTGKAGIELDKWDIGNLYTDLKKNDSNAKPVALEAISSKYGKSGLYQETPPNILVAFNSKASEEKVIAGIKFLDWMLEKGWDPIKNGFENEHYKVANGVKQKLDAAQFDKQVSYATEYAVINQEQVKPEWFPLMAPADAISQEYAKAKANSLTVALKNPYRRDIAYSPDLAELTQLIAAFNPIEVQIETKVMTAGGAMTAQQGIEEIRKEWKRLGGENVEKLVNDWYQKNKDQLKVKPGK
jgi:putative aldouronate transport system substrate-binding protein